MTFGSLFAGIGGMDLGLERAGLTCRWQVEVDEYATRILERHWPGVRRWRDIKTFLPDTKGERFGAWGPGRVAARRQRRRDSSWASGWRVDLIAGGFPCQDISYAGAGAGLSGKRSGLWFELARVVRTLEPRYVLVENVAALLTRGLDAVLGTLASLGYDAEWFCLPAAAVGAPHIRDRVFIVAYANPDSVGQRLRVPGCGPDAGASRGVQEEAWKRERIRADARPVRRGLSDAPGERLEVGFCLGTDARQELATTLRANRSDGGQWGFDPADIPESGVGRVVDGVSHRVDRLRGLGNAVVPAVSEFIGRRILAADGGLIP